MRMTILDNLAWITFLFHLAWITFFFFFFYFNLSTLYLYLVFHCIIDVFSILLRLFFMPKKLTVYALNYSKKNLCILWSNWLKSGMKLEITFRSLPIPFRICKCVDRLLMNFGPLILFHGTWKNVILVHGMSFNATLKALFRHVNMSIFLSL